MGRDSTPQGVSWLGFFYGGNIAGAVFGALVVGLLPAARVRHGDGHRMWPLRINVAVAGVALIVAARTPA